jgi:TetR/AcrR family tetracycline transcriptional repressor
VPGPVQEEQAAPGLPDDRPARAVDPAAHPALHRVAAHLRPEAFEDRFAFGLDAILSGLPE